MPPYHASQTTAHNKPQKCYNIADMDNTDNFPTRKHLPHTPPVSVSQYAAGAPYFITICADRRHYGIIDAGCVVPNAPAVGRVVLNAPNDGGIGICRPTTPNDRPTTTPLTDANNAIRLLFALDHYRIKGAIFPQLAVVMPDHIHVIASFSESVVMAQLIRSWKRWTAKATGIVWQDGFFDHRLRNDAELAEKMDYVANNPVRKALCESADAWPFRMTWQ